MNCEVGAWTIVNKEYWTLPFLETTVPKFQQLFMTELVLSWNRFQSGEKGLSIEPVWEQVACFGPLLTAKVAYFQCLATLPLGVDQSTIVSEAGKQTHTPRSSGTNVDCLSCSPLSGKRRSPARGNKVIKPRE